MTREFYDRLPQDVRDQVHGAARRMCDSDDSSVMTPTSHSCVQDGCLNSDFTMCRWYDKAAKMQGVNHD